MTEREKVMLQRKAAMTMLVELWGLAEGPESQRARESRVAALFPLPKVTRPRVATAAYNEYRVVNGVVEYRAIGGQSWFLSPVTVEQLRALGSLPDNPTEEVEDEDE